jgi:hypothetical protein
MGVMSNYMRKIIALALLIFSNFAFAEIETISILDGQFKIVNTISSSKDIAAFTDIWNTKIEARVKIKINWNQGYKIDISGSSSNGRWLYYGGWVMPLTKSLTGLYQVINQQEFESVLGITHNQKHQRTP